MKKLLIASALSLCLPAVAQADALGLRIGVNAWQQNYEGTTQSGPDQIDIEDDLGYSDDDGFQGYISFEHPIPIIPNILIQRTVIDSDANGTLNNVEFDGEFYDGDVGSTMDLTHTDATLYYEILDNWISLDLGLTARVFEEGIELEEQSTNTSSSLDIDYAIPMLYAAVKFDLPLTGLYVGADGNGVSYDDDTLLDLKAMVGWESPIGLGIELGYRYFDLEYEDGEDKADVTIEGPYAGLFFHF